MILLILSLFWFVLITLAIFWGLVLMFKALIRDVRRGDNDAIFKVLTMIVVAIIAITIGSGFYLFKYFHLLR